MPHPGRPKGRMNKKTQQLQQEALARAQAAQQQSKQAHRAAQHNQHPHHQQQHPSRHNSAIKEDGGITLHDEADLISYRNDALIRYVSNHEYIENVTAKVIHSTKIIPPSLYPNLPKRSKEDCSKPMNPEELYYGDLEYMKYVNDNLIRDLKTMKSDDDPGFTRYLFNCPQYKVQQKRNNELEKLERELHNISSLKNLENAYESILEEYKKKFDREYVILPHMEQYSIPTVKLAPGIDVKEAPKDYNPRLMMKDTVSNLQEEQNSQQHSSSLSDQNLKSQQQQQNEYTNFNDPNSFQNSNHQINRNNNGDFTLPMNEPSEASSTLVPEDSRSNGGAAIQVNQPQSEPHKPVQEIVATNANEEKEDEDINMKDNSKDHEENGFDQEESSKQYPPYQHSENQDNINDHQVTNQDVENLFEDGDDNNIGDNGKDMHDGNDKHNENGEDDIPLNMEIDVDADLNDHSAIVNDELGDLYDFDGNDDIMGGDSAFEQDFLNQINNID
ncbi:uncharacterized protein KGF55_001852 [Candida pseudojiufengensis]|uniref:uncharacterized protein n=1 Tax=Candida pseudojiufengensis TaxID=497109 RepID=UPI002224B554|nr:uncharacterized protein KGF55_001852 [Candida pseudojiufengensis]KAI5964782.1 hypothetical protein KGF55_001852 [Candida pseudojiufengensis]